MKILSIEYTLEKIALKTPFKTALRTAWDVEFVRVCVRCENGLFAYGEAPATKAITGEGLEEIVSSLESVHSLFIGKSMKEAFVLLDTLALIGSSAKAALDIAFVFLDALQKKQTLFEYFKTQNKEPIQSAITISFNEPDEMLRDAKKAYQEGMNILKIKLGKDIHHAIEVVHLIAKKLPEAILLIDANQAWDVEGAQRFISATSSLDVALIEQPVGAKERAAMAELTRDTLVPILADESVFTLEDMRYVVENNCADMVNIKLMKCGGIRKALEMLEYARTHKIKCMMGSMLEGPNSIRAALHLSFAYRDVITFIDLDSPMLYKKSEENMPQDFIYQQNKISLA
jgi:L-Ala-D/L-Glu epimerase